MDNLPENFRQILREEQIEEAAMHVKTCQSSLQEEKKFDKTLLGKVKEACVKLSCLLTNDAVLRRKPFLTKLAEDVKYQPAEFAARVMPVLAVYQSAVDLICIHAIFDTTTKWTCLEDLEKLCDTATNKKYRKALESVEKMREDLAIIRSNDFVFLENAAFPDHVLYVGKCVDDGIFHKPVPRAGPKLAQGIVALTLENSVPNDFSEAHLKEGESSAEIKYGDRVAVSCPAYRYKVQDATTENADAQGVLAYVKIGYTGGLFHYTFRFGDPNGQYVGKLKSDSGGIPLFTVMKCGYIYRYPGNWFSIGKNKCFFAEKAEGAIDSGSGQAAMLWEMQPTKEGKAEGTPIRDGDSVFIRCYQRSAGEDCYLTFKPSTDPSEKTLVTSSIKQEYRLRLVRLIPEEDMQREMYGSEENFKGFEKAINELGNLFVQENNPEATAIVRVMERHTPALQTVRFYEKYRKLAIASAFVPGFGLPALAARAAADQPEDSNALL